VRLPLPSTAFVLGLALFATRAALAANPTGGCTEQTYGAACDHDGTNPCSGVCLPDFSQAGTPMACVAADAAALAGLSYQGSQLTSLDGAGCSPSGSAGSDCAHSCKAGACVAENATSGAECQPVGGGVNVCNGACNGDGSCSAVQNGGEKYGRSMLASCLYVACEPLSNSPSITIEFPSPTGTSCDPQDSCITGATCTDMGLCIGTPISGCSLPSVDGGLSTHGAGGTSAEGSSSGGCSVGAPRSRTCAGGVALLLGLTMLARRRRPVPTAS
jgi:hypothetical protein